VLVAGLVFFVIVTLLLSVAGPEPGTTQAARRPAVRS